MEGRTLLIYRATASVCNPIPMSTFLLSRSLSCSLCTLSLQVSLLLFSNCLKRFSHAADTHVWSKMETRGALVKRRHRHSACVYQDKMYVFGGAFVDTCYNDFYSFDFGKSPSSLLFSRHTLSLSVSSYPHLFLSLSSTFKDPLLFTPLISLFYTYHVFLSLCLPLCLSVSLSLCLSVSLCLCLPVSLPLCLSVSLSLYPSASVCVSVSLSLCL